MSTSIQIGIAHLDNQLPAWQFKLIKELSNNAQLSVTHQLIDNRKVEVKAASKLSKWHLQMDRKRYGESPDAEAVHQLTALSFLNKGTTLSCIDSQAENTCFSADLLVWLSPNEPPSYLYPCFPLGIWMYVYGDEAIANDQWLGYWEFAHLKGVMQSTLIIKRGTEAITHTYQITKSMVPAMAISRARNQHFWKLTGIMLRALQELAHLGEAAFFQQLTKRPTPKNGQLSSFKPPTNYDASINIGRHSTRLLHKAWKKLNYREQWILLIAKGKQPVFDFSAFKKIIPPKDRFWADPFILQEKDKHYLFFEELEYATNKGVLKVAEITPAGKLENISTILEQAYHLSYPFVFSYQNKWYMVPEAHQSNAIQLYEATNFPYQWKFKMHLMQGVCAMDSTLFYHNEKWWLFTTLTEQKGASHHDELFLFFADSPLTDSWQPHPMNPIVSDVSSARPAGRIFQHNNKIIRPSQDCTRKYGFGFHLNEIIQLSTMNYEEKSVLHVRPDWDPQLHRTHSFAYQTGWTVIDGLIQRRRIL